MRATQGAASSAQATDRSLPGRPESSFPPLGLLSPRRPLRWVAAGAPLGASPGAPRQTGGHKSPLRTARRVVAPYGPAVAGASGRMISAPTSSAQVTDRSLRRKRQSSFPPLCPCSRRGIAIPGPNWPANRAAPFSRLVLSATGGASPGNSPHRTRFAGLRRGPRYWFRYRRCRALGGTHRDYPANPESCCAVPGAPAGPPSVPCP